MPSSTLRAVPARSWSPGGASSSAGGDDRERGLQQPPLQLAPLLPDHVLPLPEVQEPGLVRRPRRQPGELLRRQASAAATSPSAGTSVPSSRTCRTVTENLTVTAAPPVPA